MAENRGVQAALLTALLIGAEAAAARLVLGSVGR
jgi:hypothetical protein